MSKKNLISNYISKSTEILEKGNQNEAMEFVKEVLAVFKSEINNLETNLDFSNKKKMDKDCNYLKDVKLLQAQLKNYKENIKAGYIPYKETNKSINVQTTITNKVETNIVIEYEKVIENINKLPNDILSKEEKEALEEKIASLQMELSKTNKDKNKICKRLMNVLKFTIEKGPEVYVYIARFLNFVSTEILPLLKI